MIKKYSFNDGFGHTRMVLDGIKTHVILPAPPDPGYAKFHIIENKLIFVDFFGKIMEEHRLPLVPGSRYKIMRPYRDIAKLRSADYHEGDYAWRDKRAVPLSKLKDEFGVYDVKYKPIEKVLEHEWIGNGVGFAEGGGFCFDDVAGGMGDVYPVMMMDMFHFVPKYVYVFKIGMISENSPGFPVCDEL